MIRTALTLAARGWHVFPCQPRSKEPAVVGGCNAATTHYDTIREWWGRRPDCNAAVATGKRSGVFVIDIDGPDAEAELRKLENELGTLPMTIEVVTPRPGRHLYFRMPGALVRNSAGRIAPGIDCR